MRLIEGKTYYTKPWYGSYRSMMDRCYRKTAWNYKDYGGRGITVCDEWHDICSFGKWAEENGYRKGLSIERIDTDGNYSPENCRWATQKEQCNNRRNTKYLTAFGETHTISEWSEKTGICRSTISNRIYRLGWSSERAVSERRNKRCA